MGPGRANDPRPPREEAAALGTEHLDDTALHFDNLELSFENERMSFSDIDSPDTSNMRERRLAINCLVSDLTIPDHESEVDDEIDSIGMPTIEDSESEDEGNPRRGHVRRQVETIEAAVLDKDDVSEEDLRDPFFVHPHAIDSGPRDRGVGFEH